MLLQWQNNNSMNIEELKQRAATGDAEAQYNFFLGGGIYWCGLGVEQNYEEAVKWWRLVTEKGNEDAKEALKSLQNE